jgi:hypothetical protein
MPQHRQQSPHDLIPVKTVLKRVLGARTADPVRFLLSRKASRQLELAHQRSGIDKHLLADAAMQALRIAISGNKTISVPTGSPLSAYLRANRIDDPTTERNQPCPTKSSS